jgi:hypothetical protein
MPVRPTLKLMAAATAMTVAWPRRVCSGFAVVLQKPMSLCLVEFPVPTVAVKLEDDSAVRIGLPAIEAAV